VQVVDFETRNPESLPKLTVQIWRKQDVVVDSAPEVTVVVGAIAVVAAAADEAVAEARLKRKSGSR
jgi:hypothetical protein